MRDACFSFSPSLHDSSTHARRTLISPPPLLKFAREGSLNWGRGGGGWLNQGCVVCERACERACARILPYPRELVSIRQSSGRYQTCENEEGQKKEKKKKDQDVARTRRRSSDELRGRGQALFFCREGSARCSDARPFCLSLSLSHTHTEKMMGSHWDPPSLARWLPRAREVREPKHRIRHPPPPLSLPSSREIDTYLPQTKDVSGRREQHGARILRQRDKEKRPRGAGTSSFLLAGDTQRDTANTQTSLTLSPHGSCVFHAATYKVQTVRRRRRRRHPPPSLHRFSSQADRDVHAQDVKD
ncbi:hypothetical protein LX36DRAFT_406512 [Colletotrichum falcatum]|nr:hypothetical protein LX36DRAFT_406512 [Colletotrichum falcatum]